jgi:4-amino-4-deoxy-L-arabinose transferase-like glycosyltransferase
LNLTPVVLTGVAVVLGGLFLGRHSFWWDESFSVAVANESLPHLWTQLGRETNMALYYVVLHLWLGFGDGEFVVRSLSVVCAAAAVPFVYATTARLYSARAATLAAGLLVVNPMFVAYAQEARSYAMTVLLVSAASYVFVRAIEDGSGRSWVAYVLLCSAAFYAHYFAGFVVLAHACTISLVPATRRPTTRQMATVYGSIAALTLPTLLLGRDETSKAAWIPKPGITGVPHVLKALAGGTTTLLLVAFIACVPFLVAAWRERRSPRAWAYWFVLAWLVIPVVASYVVSFAQPIFIARYLIVSLPALLIAMGVGLASMTPRWVGVVLATLAVLLSARTVWNAYHDPLAKENWRGAASFLQSHARPGDGLVAYPADVRIPLDYYLAREGGSSALGVVYPDLSWSAGVATEELPQPTTSGLAAAEKPFRRIWVIQPQSLLVSSEEESARRVASSVRNRPLLHEWDFVRVSVELYGA